MERTSERRILGGLHASRAVLDSPSFMTDHSLRKRSLWRGAASYLAVVRVLARMMARTTVDTRARLLHSPADCPVQPGNDRASIAVPRLRCRIAERTDNIDRGALGLPGPCKPRNSPVCIHTMPIARPHDSVVFVAWSDLQSGLPTLMSAA